MFHVSVGLNLDRTWLNDACAPHDMSGVIHNYTRLVTELAGRFRKALSPVPGTSAFLLLLLTSVST